MKKKILVTGPALTTSGYGEQSRFAIRALRSREDLFDIYLTPTSWGHCGWIHDDNEERKWLDGLIMKTVQYTQASNNQPQYDMSLQITIPNEWKKIAPINVGYTAGIEVNKISPAWVQPSNQMDKIIVVSSFAKKGFDNGVFTVTNQQTGQQIQGYKVNTPIEVVNYSIRKNESTQLELNLTTDFNFLVVAQAGPRKNFANTVKWFVEEFKNDNVGLICKTHLGGASQIDREAITSNLEQILAPYKDRKCKVYLLHGDMSEGEMAGLYTHPKVKALISLSHGEGFGLPLFEAAGYGLPVITTEWSGHTDFMYCPNKEGKVKPHFAKVDFTLGPVQPEALWGGVIEKETMWAFPVGNSAKTQMRGVYKDWDRYRGQAKRLAAHIEKEFATDKIYEQFVNEIIGKSNLKPQEFDGISFCIPTNGKRPEKTELTIKSIKAQVGKPVEIIFCGDVDNFKHIEGVTLIDRKQEAHSRKVALLRNKAAEKAKYSVIAWCDDDVMLDNNWLKNTVDYSLTSGWEVLGNKVYNQDATRYWDRATLNPHKLVDYDYPNYSKALYQSSAFFIIRKSVFNKVKWNEDRLVYADREGQIPEDVQYSFDLINNSYKLDFNEFAVVWHNDETYTEFSNGAASLTMKKDLLTNQYNINFFLPEDDDFSKLVEILNA